MAVAFEPAGPGSPPPAWPISGESYKQVPHAETDDVKVVVCGSFRAHSVCVQRDRRVLGHDKRIVNQV